jgi:hypothetical protein
LPSSNLFSTQKETRMNSKKLFAAGALGVALAAGAALAQDTTTTTTTMQRQTTAAGKPVTVSGTVVKVAPGQAIVLRGKDGQEVTYPLGTDVVVPSEAVAGSTVILYGDATGQKVSRVTISNVSSGDVNPGVTASQGSTYGSQGGVSSFDASSSQAVQAQTSTTTTQSTTTQEGSAEPADVTTVTGTVQAYESGRSITITKPDGTQVTYVVNAQSAVPQKLVTGKTVTVRTTKVSGQPTVQRVTYTTTTTTPTKPKS